MASHADAAARSDAEGNVLQEGRTLASSRTRTRALLRKRARERKRAQAQAPTGAPMAEESLNHMEEDCSPTVGGVLPPQVWEHPLTRSQKKDRLLFLNRQMEASLAEENWELAVENDRLRKVVQFKASSLDSDLKDMQYNADLLRHLVSVLSFQILGEEEDSNCATTEPAAQQSAASSGEEREERGPRGKSSERRSLVQSRVERELHCVGLHSSLEELKGSMDALRAELAESRACPSPAGQAGPQLEVAHFAQLHALIDAERVARLELEAQLNKAPNLRSLLESERERRVTFADKVGKEFNVLRQALEDEKTQRREDWAAMVDRHVSHRKETAATAEVERRSLISFAEEVGAQHAVHWEELAEHRQEHEHHRSEMQASSLAVGEALQLVDQERSSGLKVMETLGERHTQLLESIDAGNSELAKLISLSQEENSARTHLEHVVSDLRTVTDMEREQRIFFAKNVSNEFAALQQALADEKQQGLEVAASMSDRHVELKTEVSSLLESERRSLLRFAEEVGVRHAVHSEELAMQRQEHEQHFAEVHASRLDVSELQEVVGQERTSGLEAIQTLGERLINSSEVGNAAHQRLEVVVSELRATIESESEQRITFAEDVGHQFAALRHALEHEQTQSVEAVTALSDRHVQLKTEVASLAESERRSLLRFAEEVGVRHAVHSEELAMQRQEHEQHYAEVHASRLDVSELQELVGQERTSGLEVIQTLGERLLSSSEVENDAHQRLAAVVSDLRATIENEREQRITFAEDVGNQFAALRHALEHEQTQSVEAATELSDRDAQHRRDLVSLVETERRSLLGFAEEVGVRHAIHSEELAVQRQEQEHQFSEALQSRLAVLELQKLVDQERSSGSDIIQTMGQRHTELLHVIDKERSDLATLIGAFEVENTARQRLEAVVGSLQDQLASTVALVPDFAKTLQEEREAYGQVFRSIAAERESWKQAMQSDDQLRADVFKELAALRTFMEEVGQKLPLPDTCAARPTSSEQVAGSSNSRDSGCSAASSMSEEVAQSAGVHVEASQRQLHDSPATAFVGNLDGPRSREVAAFHEELASAVALLPDFAKTLQEEREACCQAFQFIAAERVSWQQAMQGEMQTRVDVLQELAAMRTVMEQAAQKSHMQGPACVPDVETQLQILAKPQAEIAQLVREDAAACQRIEGKMEALCKELKSLSEERGRTRCLDIARVPQPIGLARAVLNNAYFLAGTSPVLHSGSSVATSASADAFDEEVAAAEACREGTQQLPQLRGSDPSLREEVTPLNVELVSAAALGPDLVKTLQEEREAYCQVFRSMAAERESWQQAIQVEDQARSDSLKQLAELRALMEQVTQKLHAQECVRLALESANMHNPDSVRTPLDSELVRVVVDSAYRRAPGASAESVEPVGACCKGAQQLQQQLEQVLRSMAEERAFWQQSMQAEEQARADSLKELAVFRTFMEEVAQKFHAQESAKLSHESATVHNLDAARTPRGSELVRVVVDSAYRRAPGASPENVEPAETCCMGEQQLQRQLEQVFRSMAAERESWQQSMQAEEQARADSLKKLAAMRTSMEEVAQKLHAQESAKLPHESSNVHSPDAVRTPRGSGLVRVVVDSAYRRAPGFSTESAEPAGNGCKEAEQLRRQLDEVLRSMTAEREAWQQSMQAEEQARADSLKELAVLRAFMEELARKLNAQEFAKPPHESANTRSLGSAHTRPGSELVRVVLNSAYHRARGGSLASHGGASPESAEPAEACCKAVQELHRQLEQVLQSMAAERESWQHAMKAEDQARANSSKELAALRTFMEEVALKVHAQELATPPRESSPDTACTPQRSELVRVVLNSAYRRVHGGLPSGYDDAVPTCAELAKHFCNGIQQLQRQLEQVAALQDQVASAAALRPDLAKVLQDEREAHCQALRSIVAERESWQEAMLVEDQARADALKELAALRASMQEVVQKLQTQELATLLQESGSSRNLDTARAPQRADVVRIVLNSAYLRARGGSPSECNSHSAASAENAELGCNAAQHLQQQLEQAVLLQAQLASAAAVGPDLAKTLQEEREAYSQVFRSMAAERESWQQAMLVEDRARADALRELAAMRASMQEVAQTLQTQEIARFPHESGSRRNLDTACAPQRADVVRAVLNSAYLRARGGSPSERNSRSAESGETAELGCKAAQHLQQQLEQAVLLQAQLASAAALVPDLAKTLQEEREAYSQVFRSIAAERESWQQAMQFEGQVRADSFNELAALQAFMQDVAHKFPLQEVAALQDQLAAAAALGPDLAKTLQEEREACFQVFRSIAAEGESWQQAMQNEGSIRGDALKELAALRTFMEEVAQKLHSQEFTKPAIESTSGRNLETPRTPQRSELVRVVVNSAYLRAQGRSSSTRCNTCFRMSESAELSQRLQLQLEQVASLQDQLASAAALGPGLAKTLQQEREANFEVFRAIAAERESWQQAMQAEDQVRAQALNELAALHAFMQEVAQKLHLQDVASLQDQLAAAAALGPDLAKTVQEEREAYFQVVRSIAAERESWQQAMQVEGQVRADMLKELAELRAFIEELAQKSHSQGPAELRLENAEMRSPVTERAAPLAEVVRVVVNSAYLCAGGSPSGNGVGSILPTESAEAAVAEIVGEEVCYHGVQRLEQQLAQVGSVQNQLVSAAALWPDLAKTLQEEREAYCQVFHILAAERESWQQAMQMDDQTRSDARAELASMRALLEEVAHKLRVQELATSSSERVGINDADSLHAPPLAHLARAVVNSAYVWAGDELARCPRRPSLTSGSQVSAREETGGAANIEHAVLVESEGAVHEHGSFASQELQQLAQVLQHIAAEREARHIEDQARAVAQQELAALRVSVEEIAQKLHAPTCCPVCARGTGQLSGELSAAQQLHEDMDIKLQVLAEPQAEIAKLVREDVAARRRVEELVREDAAARRRIEDKMDALCQEIRKIHQDACSTGTSSSSLAPQGVELEQRQRADSVRSVLNSAYIHASGAPAPFDTSIAGGSSPSNRSAGLVTPPLQAAKALRTLGEHHSGTGQRWLEYDADADMDGAHRREAEMAQLVREDVTARRRIEDKLETLCQEFKKLSEGSPGTCSRLDTARSVQLTARSVQLTASPLQLSAPLQLSPARLSASCLVRAVLDSAYLRASGCYSAAHDYEVSESPSCSSSVAEAATSAGKSHSDRSQPLHFLWRRAVAPPGLDLGGVQRHEAEHAGAEHHFVGSQRVKRRSPIEASPVLDATDGVRRQEELQALRRVAGQHLRKAFAEHRLCGLLDGALGES